MQKEDEEYKDMQYEKVQNENGVLLGAPNGRYESKNFVNEDEQSKNVQKHAEYKKARTVIEETTTLQNEDKALENMQNEIDESESVKSESVKFLNELRPLVAQGKPVPTPLPLSFEHGVYPSVFSLRSLLAE